MTNRAQYVNLMDKWREKETLAELMRKFADEGGRHRLKIKVEHPDPVIAGNAERFINEMLKNNGFGLIVQQALEKADRASKNMQEAFLQQAGAGYLQT